MKTKELNIVVPDGYEIDEENSTLNKILFKQIKPISWEHLNSITGYYVISNSEVRSASSFDPKKSDKNIFKTEDQAKAAIALAKISQLIPLYIKRYYEENPYWEPDWVRSDYKYCIGVINDSFYVISYLHLRFFIAFPTEEIAEKFLSEQAVLLRLAKPLL